MKRLLFLTLVGYFCLVAQLFAQVPQMLHYQGRIVSGSTNFEGAGLFKFALVGTNQSGTVVTLWSNTGSSTGGNEPGAPVNIAVTKGLYSVLLGDVSLPNMISLPPTVFTNTDVRLRVWFNDGVHGFQVISPDQRIAAVGYALMAASVPDGAITPPKLSPGVAGQVLMTDDDGRANWSPASAVSAYVANDPLSQAAADPAENTALIEISGVFTNQVVIVGGLSVELGLNQEVELRQVGDPQWERIRTKADFQLKTYSGLAFEFAGSRANVLIAETNASPRALREVRIMIKDSFGNEKCRWTLPSMELVTVQPGSGGRLRYLLRPNEEFYGRTKEIKFLRTPESFPYVQTPRVGFDDRLLEIQTSTINGSQAPDNLQIDPRNKTITLTVAGGELGVLFKWFKDCAQENSFQLGIISAIKYKKEVSGTWTEIFRDNCYDLFPFRYEVLTGFGGYERYKERIVFKYLIRERG